MPSQISNATAIRASGYKIRCYASFYTGGTPVATGDVTYAPDDTLVVKQDIQIDFDTGAYTAIQRGMDVEFFDSGGARKGRNHIRFGGVITSGSIPVREYGNAKLLLTIGDRYAIYPEYRIHDKLVAANNLFPPDYLPYTDQGSNPPPVACSGGHYAGKLDAGQTYATVLTTGSTSYTVDPDSGGSLTHLWTLPSGVTFAPGSASTDANPTLRATLGEYVVDHAVTDSSNSKTTVQHIVLKVHDPANMPHQILWTPDTATAESGFGGTVEILRGATTQAAIPDGCLCIIWGAETVNGQLVSYRNAASGRSHILCVGIVRRDFQEGAPDGSRRVTFEVISPLQRLKELTSYSKVMEANATPNSWSQVKTLGVKRAIIQLIQFYTTLIEAGFDLIFDSAFIDYLYPAFYLQRSTFYSQMEELAQGVDARTTCDRTGRFNLHTDPRYIPEASRAAITKTWTFAPRDVLSFSLPREQADTVEIMKVSGISGGVSGNAPFFSVTPGTSPGEAAGTPSRERLILNPADPQADVNERAGRFFAAEDAVYQNADGLKWRAFPLTLVLRGVYDFFDFAKEYVDFSENIRNLARDVDLTDFLFCLQSTSVGYDPERGVATTTCVFDVVTNAAPGESYFPPPNESIPSTTLPTFPPIVLPSLFPGTISRAAADMAAICINGIFLTDKFYATFPSWVFDSQPWSGDGTLIEWCPDGYASPAAGWILTDEVLAYYVFETATYTVKHTFSATSAFRSLDASFAEQGFIAVNSYYPSGGGTKVLHSVDNTSFTETTVNSYDGIAGAFIGIYVSSKVAGKIVVSAQTASTTSAAYISLDYGATWGTISPAFQTSYLGYATIFAPFQGNSSDNIYYYPTADLGTGDNDELFRNSTNVSPNIAGSKYTPVPSRRGLDASVANRNRMLVVGERDSGSFVNVGLFLTNDAGASYSVLEQNTALRRCAISGNDPNRGWCWGVGVLKQIDITGSTATLSDRMGNLASLTPGEIIGLAGV